MEAPNFSRDVWSLIFDADGRVYRLPLDGSRPLPIDTGFASRCNNDHGLSPDGRRLAISDKTEYGKPAIYMVATESGIPRLDRMPISEPGRSASPV